MYKLLVDEQKELMGNKVSIYFLIRILPLSVQTVIFDVRSAIGVASSTRTIYFKQSHYAYVYAFTNAFHLTYAYLKVTMVELEWRSLK